MIHIQENNTSEKVTFSGLAFSFETQQFKDLTYQQIDHVNSASSLVYGWGKIF